MTVAMARGMYALMDLADNDLLDTLLNRPAKPLAASDPEAQVVQSVLALPEVQALLPLLRT
jgi:antitoxin CptB